MSPIPDGHANFAVSNVVTAPVSPTAGTSLTVVTGEGARFPATPFNAVVCPANVVPIPANAEVVRVTNVAGDVLTITRAAEGSSARSIQVGDQIFAAVTNKTLTDAEYQFQPTAEKTADYTASVGELVLMNGAHTTTLPLAPRNGARVAINQYGAAGSVNKQGTDIIEGGLGANVTLMLGSYTVWIYVAAAGSWRRMQDSGVPVATAARAYRSAALNSSSGIFKVPLDTKNYDTGGNFNNTASGNNPYAYTCPLNGYYQVNGAIYAYTTTQAASAFIYKNGAVVAEGSQAIVSGGASAVVADLVSCAAGDFLELFAFTGGAGIGMPAFSQYNYMSVVRSSA